MKQCLVLGGKGFIGTHLVEALLRKGMKVRVLDRPDIPVRIASECANSVEWQEGDFGHETDLVNALQGCDCCFHLVSTTLPKSSNEDPVFDLETNVIATVKLLEHAVRAKVRKIVFLSSGGTVYGKPRYIPVDENHPTDPLCSYGIGKLAIEKYLALYQDLHGLEYAVLRLSNPFGEYQRTVSAQGAIGVFLGKVMRGEPIEFWGDGSVKRDYIYVGDAVEAMTAAAEYAGSERIFNVGSGQARSLLEVVDAVEGVVGYALDRRFMAARSFDVPVNVLAIDRARVELGWSPRTTFEDGLSRTFAWLQAHGNAR